MNSSRLLRETLQTTSLELRAIEAYARSNAMCLAARVRKRLLVCVLPWLAGMAATNSAAATGDYAGGADPLFSAHTPLDVRLTLPLKELSRDRDEEPEYRPAQLEFAGADGAVVSMDLEVRPRGKSRRRKGVCDVPPLRLNFKTKSVRDTVFAGQDKLKLVTHCRRTKRYDQYVWLEYTVYRMLNLLTDASFRVRPLNITYVDGDKTLDVRTGFLIEHKNRLGERIARIPVEPVSIKIRELDANHASIIELFQLMIGNTDFSLIKGPPGDNCCHNAILFEGGGSYQAIPYDFDSTGFVNPPHAVPNQALKMSSLKQRRYRGFCRTDAVFTAALQTFRDQRESLFALLDAPLNERTARTARNYVQDFYEIIDDPRSLEKRVLERCR